MEKPKYYITTPIYYPSGKWHIGHCYTTVICDAIARYKRMSGFDVFYLTGTDEHGQKIEQRAAAAETTPKVFVDGLVEEIKRLWQKLDISYDGYIRTTDKHHVESVQKIFKKLYDQGDIYKSKYKGKYCTPCEAFWTSSQLIDGKCPDCGREVTDAEEESYFFRLSKYGDRIKKLLTETDFLQPPSRVNEMVNNFIDKGLTDLAVSRTSFKWGIPVSFDEGHIVYVWIDALSNYITALNYGEADDSLFKKYWPADLHLMAKEIVRFHSVIWPAILMALDLPLPKKIYGHGWILMGGDKMSKSKGNVVDPFVLSDRYGVDALRYYLLREIPFGQDSEFTNESLIARINCDLVNNYGNLFKRTLTMAHQYLGGKVSAGRAEEGDSELIAALNGLKARVDGQFERLTVNKALEEIFSVLDVANKYIDLSAPWVLSKDEAKKPRLQAVIYNLLEALRVCSVLLLPMLTDLPKKVLGALGCAVPSDFASAAYSAKNDYTLGEAFTLLGRIDAAKELAELAKLTEEKENKDQAARAAQDGAKPKKQEEAKMDECNEITIDEFFKTQLKVAEVTACEKVEKADKLLKLTLKVGEEVRTVVSGIAKSYTPDEMVGKRVVLVANLKPALLRGIQSQGMILCATHGDKVVLVSPEAFVESGSEVR